MRDPGVQDPGRWRVFPIVSALALLVVSVAQAVAFTQHPLANGATVGFGVHQPPGPDLDDKFMIRNTVPPNPNAKIVHFHVNVCCPATCTECTTGAKKCTPEFTVTFVVKDAANVAGPMHTRTHAADTAVCPLCKDLRVDQGCGPGYANPPTEVYPATFALPPASISVSVTVACRCCEGSGGTEQSVMTRVLTAVD